MPLFGDFCEVLAKMEKVALFRLVCGALCKISKALPYSLKKYFVFSRKKFWGRKIFFQKKLPNGIFCWGPDVFMG